MKSTLRNIFLTIACCMPIAWINAQVTPENCSEMSAAQGWPSYYCDCKFNYLDFSLPLDIEISDSTWFKASLSDLSQGLSAYLYSDCDMSFDVYIACTAQEPKYQAIFTRNQTNSINAQTIKEKLEEYGYGDGDATFYICIAPIYGFGGRLLVNTINQAFSSTCDDPLHLFPGMTMLSQATNDVYVVDPNDIPYGEDVVIQWVGDNNAPCHLSVTRGACNATPFDEYTFRNSNDRFVLSAALIDEAWGTEEFLYLHFAHDATTAGTIHCLAYTYHEIISDTTICQGKGVLLADTLLTESTTYCVDTVFLHTNQYRVNYLRVTVVEPEIEPDTMAFKYTQQPYLYRNQHAISKPGNYDLTIHTPGQCDERYALHVYHDIDTLVNVVDTFLCYGASFEYNGKLYLQDVSLGTSTWKNQDTLILDTLNVYFATTPEIVYDTIMQHDYKYGKTFKQTGDFAFTYTNPTTYCVDSIYLHVLPGVDDGVKYDYYYIDTTLCQGMEYEDYYGNIYTTSTVLYDTIWRIPNKHCEIEITTITFTEPDIQFDTISLKTKQLPYKYDKCCTVDTFGLYDYTVHVGGRCDERYQLLALHDIDTIYQTIDTTLCQGNIYVYDGVEYASNTILLDTLQQGPDTCQIWTINISFTEPDIYHDTLSLKMTNLPYIYRDQYLVNTFGLHDVLISTPDRCDERYLLHVYHKIDTLRHTIDTLLCQGKFFEYEGKQYTSDTTFVKKLLLDDDTYQITTINLSFLEPEQQYISLPLKYSNLPYTYCGLTDTITAFGDYDLTIHTPGECDERHLVHAYHKMDTIQQIVDSAVCGDNFAYEDKYYTEDKTFVTYLPYNQDTVIANVLNVYFTSEKEERYQTLILKPSQLPYTYNLPDFTTWKITHFGDFDIEYTNTTTWCDVHLHLHVQPLIDTLYQSLDTTFCLGVIYLYRNTLTITSDTTFTDTLQRDADTYVITSVSVTFTAPEAIPDTLALKQTELPYTYRGQETITTFGDYDLTIRTSGECDERYLLHVYHDIDTLYTNIDTTLCEGRIFTYKEVEYTQPAILLDSNWLNMDTWQITAIDIAFTTPDMEYDTIVVKTEELLAGYYYEPADTMVYAAGDYFYEILTYNDCTRHLTLTVNEELTSAVDNLPCTEQPRLIMRNGVVYIIRGKECFTILGMKIDNNKITTEYRIKNSFFKKKYSKVW